MNHVITIVCALLFFILTGTLALNIVTIVWQICKIQKKIANFLPMSTEYTEKGDDGKMFIEKEPSLILEYSYGLYFL